MKHNAIVKVPAPLVCVGILDQLQLSWLQGTQAPQMYLSKFVLQTLMDMSGHAYGLKPDYYTTATS